MNEVTYTNWQKLPVLMPLAYRLLASAGGRAWADGLSLRALVPFELKVWAFLVAVGYLGLVMQTVRLYSRWVRSRTLQRTEPQTTDRRVRS